MYCSITEVCSAQEGETLSAAADKGCNKIIFLAKNDRFGINFSFPFHHFIKSIAGLTLTAFAK